VVSILFSHYRNIRKIAGHYSIATTVLLQSQKMQQRAKAGFCPPLVRGILVGKSGDDQLTSNLLLNNKVTSKCPQAGGGGGGVKVV
jgi:hypothetical protein